MSCTEALELSAQNDVAGSVETDQVKHVFPDIDADNGEVFEASLFLGTHGCRSEWSRQSRGNDSTAGLNGKSVRIADGDCNFIGLNLDQMQTALYAAQRLIWAVTTATPRPKAVLHALINELHAEPQHDA